MQKLMERRPQKQTLKAEICTCKTVTILEKPILTRKRDKLRIRSKSLPLSCWIRGPWSAALLVPKISMCPGSAAPSEPTAEGSSEGGQQLRAPALMTKKFHFCISSEGFGFLNYIFSENTNNSWVFSNTWIIQAGTEIAKSSGPSSS